MKDNTVLELNLMLKRTEEQRDLALGLLEEYKNIMDRQTKLIQELLVNQKIIDEDDLGTVD